MPEGTNRSLTWRLARASSALLTPRELVVGTVIETAHELSACFGTGFVAGFDV